LAEYTVLKFFSPCPGKQSLPWHFPLYLIYFLPFGIFEQLALARKNTSYSEMFHCIEIFLSFRIFEQIALALKTGFALNSLHWTYIFYHWGFLSNLHLPGKTRVALKCFIVLNIYFLSFRIFKQLALARKNTSCSEMFHCIEIFLSFWIFEQLALDLKTEFALNSLCWIYIFYHSGFLSNLRLAWKPRVALKCFTALKYFHPSVFLSNLRLPWKQDLHWIYCIEYIFFIIQDFWATCACPESRTCIEFTVLNMYFLSFRIFEQLALALKNTSCPDIFHCIEIFSSFSIFEKLALALKAGLTLNLLHWIYIFYHSVFLSNLRLSWKQSLPWIHCIEYIFFIIQDFWATCSCPENRVCHEIFQAVAAAANPTHPPRTPVLVVYSFRFYLRYGIIVSSEELTLQIFEEHCNLLKDTPTRSRFKIPDLQRSFQ